MANNTLNHSKTTSGSVAYVPGYPKYFRKEGVCAKVVSPTQVKVIKLPPHSEQPERYSSTYPTPERLASTMTDMTEVSADVFKDFLFSFYHSVEDERSKISKR